MLSLRAASVLLGIALAAACRGAATPASKDDSTQVNAGPSVGVASAGAGEVGAAGVGAAGVGGVAFGAARAVSYVSNFNLTESPLSERGAWTHVGMDWTLVNTANGLAFGTQAGGVGRYDDSYAYLSGFPPNQSVSTVIHKDPKLDTSTEHEVEILLRWSDSAHVARGYECNLAYSGAYAEIVRWNGAYSDFTYVAPQGSGGPGAVRDGDVFSAQIVGATITTFLNGVQLSQATDSKWTAGNPGIGLFRNGQAGAFPGDYCFSHFAATSLAP